MARKVSNRSEDTAVLLRKGLRRRGMTDTEIDAAIRKKKRRRVLEFNVVKSRHLVAMSKPESGQSEPRTRRVSSADREPEGRAAEELCTVHFAAEQLKLHRKTVLRFIREGRLPAKRVGKSYRIKRSDLAALGGLPAQADVPAEQPSMTSIVDVPGVSAQLAKKWQATINDSLHARPHGAAPIRADVVYEPERSHLKIIVMGTASETVHLLSLIRVWLEQLRA